MIDNFEFIDLWNSACPNMVTIEISGHEYYVLWNDHIRIGYDDIVAGLVEFDKNNAGDFKIINTLELNGHDILYLFVDNNIKIYTKTLLNYEDNNNDL